MKKRSGKATRRAKPVSRKSARLAPRQSSTGFFLVGFMGAGKTSVGRALAERLQWAFEDLDDRIEELEGRTVAEIFRDSGEPAFRRAERAVLAKLLAEMQAGATKIVALGGGAFVQAGIAAMLKKSGARTVFLDAPVEELWRRCCDQAGHAASDGNFRSKRPLLKSLEQFRKLYAARRKRYLTASLRVDTAQKTVESVAAAIAETMGLQTIAIRTEQGEVE